MQHQCENYPLGDCALPIGRPAPHWTITLHDTYATHKSNFRIHLLTGCDGLEADASRFRSRNNHSQPNNPICKLCQSEPEDHFHFIAKCPALSPFRSRLLSNIPTEIAPHLPDLHCKNKLVVLTTEWLPWLQTSWRDSGYERFALIWKSNCIRQPKMQQSNLAYNHNTLTTLRTSVRESPAYIRSMKGPYYNFEVHL